MKRILIIRPSAIGDIVMASPMLRVLRRAFPKAYIAWLVEPPLEELLADNPLLNQVIALPKCKWQTLFSQHRYREALAEIANFIRRLRAFRFDFALDAQGLLRSRLLAWLSGAPNRVGFDSKEPGEILMNRVVSRGPENKTIGAEYRQMMIALGLATGRFVPELHIGAAYYSSALQKLGTVQHAPYAVLAPFTTRPQKHWCEDRWPALAKDLKDKLRLRCILLGGPGDHAPANRILAQSENTIHDLTGQTSLGEAAALVSKARLVIGVDTGLTHMGAAFDRPVVALFGATCPYLHLPSGRTRVLYHRLACSPCKRSPTCNGAYDCMRSITRDEVATAAAALLKKRRGGQ